MNTQKNSLNINRLRNNYFILSEHPSPESLKGRLDDAVGKSLQSAISSFVMPLFSDKDVSIWFIRRLDVEVDVNAAWDREQIALCWSKQIVKALACLMQRNSDYQEILRFDSRAAYVAQFLIDLADGYAWQKWYYKTFEGLQMLPLSAAMRTLICDNPAVGLSALIHVSDKKLTNILKTLTVQDVTRILDGISKDGKTGDEFCCYQELRKAWEITELELCNEFDEIKHVLRLYVRVCQERVELSGPTLKNVAIELVRKEAVSLDTSPYKEQTKDKHITPLTERRNTNFGGVFLLLPLIDLLPITKATNNWPVIDDDATACLVRFLILMKCCGNERANQVFSDPLIRDLMGVPPIVSLADLLEWQTTISQENLEYFLDKIAMWQSEKGVDDKQKRIKARKDKLVDDMSYLSLAESFCKSNEIDKALSIGALSVMRDFSWRLPGFDGSSLAYLYSNFLEFSGSVDEEEDRRVVRLGRPPLNVVLNMTGMVRNTYKLGWLDEKPFVLFQE